MEHIREILKKQTQTSTSRANGEISSDAKTPSTPSSEEVCPVCKGAGVVHPLLPTGKPDYGRVVPCRCARERLEKERQNYLQKYSNLGLLTRRTFDNLIPEGRRGEPAAQEYFRKIFEAARAFAANPKGWLVVIGPSGSGKTHLAAAIANERIRQGNPVFFITAADLLDHLRAAFNPNSELPYDEFFDRVRNAPLLILDDLGVQSSTPWAKEKLDQLLNHRYNNELPTVITSITPVDHMEERISTRLSDTRLCQIYTIEEKHTESNEYTWGPEFELQKQMTFEKFDWKRVNLQPEQRENLEHIFRLTYEFAKSPDGWLILTGETGCGKTHLAAAIVNYRYQAKKSAQFVVVPDFLDHLRSTFTPESKVSYDQLFERVKTAPLLVLDDFGEQTTTPWAQEKLYQVINYRYNARLATVITTRCSMEEIDIRISSRLADPKISVIWNINLPDYRTDATASRKKRVRGAKKEQWG